MNLHFASPELLLLVLPVGWLLWHERSTNVTANLLRALCALALLLAAANPFAARASEGRDLWLVVDRSRSMPDGGDAAGLELVRYAEEERRAHDRVGVVTFGGAAELEASPSADSRFPGYARALDRDGSDLAGALELALELVPDGTDASLLVVSDGEHTGSDPLVVARRAGMRGIPIHVRRAARSGTLDRAVERIELPDSVESGQAFQFAAWVHADRAGPAEVVLRRGDVVVSRGVRELRAGSNRLLFRDRLAAGGIAEYEVSVSDVGTAAPDRTPENDTAHGALRVRGPARVVLLNEDGAEDSLVRALREAGLRVDAAAPETVSLDALLLGAYRAVILENVDAGRLGSRGRRALAEHVTEHGGGLLVTGGRSSYGRGGYYRSELDPLLPVSMELRQEHRKQGVALAIAMDRSGSMQAPVAGNRTKMDLANAGAVAAIEMLSSADSVAVLAVDTEAHVVQPTVAVDDLAALVSRVRRIRSQGGGIFVFNALEAALRELDKAPQQSKHIVLFADAADSEQQEGVMQLLLEAAPFGVTCSVIALGTRGDADATFLSRVADVGQGQAYFTTSPTDLPRLFAQDTLAVSRATFVEDPTGVDVLPGLLGLGDVALDGFPALAGYNLTYLRPECAQGLATTDEYRAPILAWSYRGLGRVAAFAGQIGGEFGAEVVAWPGFQALFSTVVRWTTGLEQPGDVFASLEREGGEAVFEVEFADDSPTLEGGRTDLIANLTRPDGTTVQVPFERVGSRRFRARTPLEQVGTSVGTLVLDEGAADREASFLTLPPVSLPYSPEFERRADPDHGARLLRALAATSGGRELASPSDLFAGPTASRAWRSLQVPLALAALVLLVLEIAVRRLALLQRIPVPRRSVASGAEPRPAGPERPRAATTPEARPAASAAPESSPPPAVGDALERARRRASERLR